MDYDSISEGEGGETLQGVREGGYGGEHGGATAEESDGESLLGIPEGGYSDFTMPEGSVVDPDMMKLATDGFSEMGLSQQGAQKAMDLYTKAVEYQDAKFEEYRQSTVSGWKNAWKKDREFGGKNLKQSQAYVNKAVSVVFKNDPYRTIARYAATGQEFDPGLLRAFAIVGRMLSDGSFAGGRGPGRAGIHRRLYPNLP